MFAIYSPEGRSFLGTLERLYKVHPISPVPAKFKNLDDQKVSTREERGHPFRGNQELERAQRAYRDMLNATPPRQPLTHAHQIMSHPVITIEPFINIADAWQYFRKKKVHQMPVLTEQFRLLGLLTENDLLRYLLVSDGKTQAIPHKTVADAMSSPVISADPITDVRRIAKVMVDHRMAGVPIVNEQQELVGMVCLSDILRCVAKDPPLELWG